MMKVTWPAGAVGEDRWMNIWVGEVSPSSAVTTASARRRGPEVHVHPGGVVPGQVADHRVVAGLEVDVSIWVAPGVRAAPVSAHRPGGVLVDAVRVALEPGDRVVRGRGLGLQAHELVLHVGRVVGDEEGDLARGGGRRGQVDEHLGRGVVAQLGGDHVLGSAGLEAAGASAGAAPLPRLGAARWCSSLRRAPPPPGQPHAASTSAAATAAERPAPPRHGASRPHGPLGMSSHHPARTANASRARSERSSPASGGRRRPTRTPAP